MDLSGVKIRNITGDDIKAMKEFAEAVNSQDNLEISIPDHAIDFFLSNEEVRNSMFLAYLDDKLIGFASCMRNVSNSENGNFELIIHPNYRQQGLGRIMYGVLLEQGKSKGMRNITAFAKERMQQSLDFLQNRGFAPQSYSWKMDLGLSNIDYKIIPADLCNIRKITLEDGKTYADIMNAGFKKAGDELYTEKSFEMMLKNPEEYVFFIEQDGKIVATAAVSLEKDISRGYIHNVTVYSDYRGRGFGEISLNHCINIIKEAGLSKASLNVYGDNKNALNLYKKLGFEEMDTHVTFKGEI